MNTLCPKLFFVYICALFAVQSAFATNTLTREHKAAIATRFAAEVKYNFAGYGKFAQNYDSICRAELPKLVNTQSDEEFGMRIQEFAHILKDGHTSIVFKADVTCAPILQKRIGDKVFVTEAFSDEYVNKGVRKGTEILTIDNIPVIEYGRTRVAPYIPSSTEQWSETYPFNSINLTKGYRNEGYLIKFKNPDEEPFEIYEPMQSPWGIVKPDRSIKFDVIGDNIGLLTIPSFQAGSFNIETFGEIYENQILNTDGLIIDLRDNTGGNGRYGEIVMRLLANDTIPQAAWETPKYEAAYASWGRAWQTETIEGKPLIPISEMPKYNKPIVLLVNGGTFSAAEDFTVLFKNVRRGKVIGTPTGGSTGNPIVIDLGWGYYGKICTRHERLADGTEFIGIGIKPDIVVEEDEGVIFGKDNVIEAAFKELSR